MRVLEFIARPCSPRIHLHHSPPLGANRPKNMLYQGQVIRKGHAFVGLFSMCHGLVLASLQTLHQTREGGFQAVGFLPLSRGCHEHEDAWIAHHRAEDGEGVCAKTPFGLCCVEQATGCSTMMLALVDRGSVIQSESPCVRGREKRQLPFTSALPFFHAARHDEVE